MHSDSPFRLEWSKRLSGQKCPKTSLERCKSFLCYLAWHRTFLKRFDEVFFNFKFKKTFLGCSSYVFLCFAHWVDDSRAKEVGNTFCQKSGSQLDFTTWVTRPWDRVQPVCIFPREPCRALELKRNCFHRCKSYLREPRLDDMSCKTKFYSIISQRYTFQLQRSKFCYFGLQTAHYHCTPFLYW